MAYKCKTTRRLSQEHKDGIRRAALQWRREGARKEEKYRRHWMGAIRRKYNLEPIDIAHMLERQEHHCALCPTRFTEQDFWVVDHDHATHRIRGLLCTRCNYRKLPWVEQVGLERLALYLRGDA